MPLLLVRVCANSLFEIMAVFSLLNNILILSVEVESSSVKFPKAFGVDSKESDVKYPVALTSVYTPTSLLNISKSNAVRKGIIRIIVLLYPVESAFNRSTFPLKEEVPARKSTNEIKEFVLSKTKDLTTSSVSNALILYHPFGTTKKRLDTLTESPILTNKESIFVLISSVIRNLISVFEVGITSKLEPLMTTLEPMLSLMKFLPFIVKVSPTTKKSVDRLVIVMGKIGKESLHMHAGQLVFGHTGQIMFGQVVFVQVSGQTTGQIMFGQVVSVQVSGQTTGQIMSGQVVFVQVSEQTTGQIVSGQSLHVSHVGH